MTRRIKGAAALLAAAFLICCLAGCMPASVEELYSLPQMSEEYIQLQELIAGQLESGGAYAAPTGGSNRQSVQLRDLDGDGTAEALAFLSGEDSTPMICVYRRGEDGNYYHYVTIIAEGSSVYSVDYADLNGDGSAELIVAWQIGGDLRQLSVYALGSADPSQQMRLLTADCTQFVVCDLDGNGVPDLLDLRVGYGGSNSLVMYTLEGDNEPASTTASLSGGVTALRRAVTGTLSDGTTALFVESDLADQGLVTDVFTARDGRVENITISGLGRSSFLRPEGLFAADLNGDDAMEIPAGSGEFITWYGLDRSGTTHAAVTTYHNAEDGWYFVLPDSLSQGVTAERHGAGGGERAVVFIQEGDQARPQRSVLVIYVLTGENRQDRAEVDSRFVLRQDEDAVYAAQLLTDELTQEEIRDNFYILYDQWQTGDL